MKFLERCERYREREESYYYRGILRFYVYCVFRFDGLVYFYLQDEGGWCVYIVSFEIFVVGSFGCVGVIVGGITSVIVRYLRRVILQISYKRGFWVQDRYSVVLFFVCWIFGGISFWGRRLGSVDEIGQGFGSGF